MAGAASAPAIRLEVGGVSVEVIRKDIKHLHLGVHPPDGRVRVSAPMRLDDEAVRTAVVTRLAWIRRKRDEFRKQQRETRRAFVSGESHWFEGRRYRLDVIESSGPARVRLRSNAWIELRVRPGTDRDAREKILYAWYRARLRERIPVWSAKWEPKVGVRVAEWRIRRMKTRWGTCNTHARRVWLNSELAKKPLACTEYVALHEMVHLVEPSHNDRFHEIMDALMPRWRLRADELNRTRLADEEWGDR